MFIDKLEHKPTIHRSQQTHRKIRLHRIDLQENRGELCIETQRERRSHLAPSYGPVGQSKLLTHHRRGHGVDGLTLSSKPSAVIFLDGLKPYLFVLSSLELFDVISV